MTNPLHEAEKALVAGNTERCPNKWKCRNASDPCHRLSEEEQRADIEAHYGCWDDLLSRLRKKCGTCKGDGTVQVWAALPDVAPFDPCPDCNGSGWWHLGDLVEDMALLIKDRSLASLPLGLLTARAVLLARWDTFAERDESAQA